MSQKHTINHQPTATKRMTLSGGNRNAKNLPVTKDGRDWSHSLFDCFSDCSTCCAATWCPCIIYAKNKRRIEHLDTAGVPDPEHGGSGFNDDCMHYGALNLCCASWIPQMKTRLAIRTRYDILGDENSDRYTSTCFRACALVQESREIELEEQSFNARRPSLVLRHLG